MHSGASVLLLFSTVIVVSASATAADTRDASAKVSIARAMRAAPASVTAGATFIDMNPAGKVTVLRIGTNGFT